jgi:hypothetical protein
LKGNEPWIGNPGEYILRRSVLEEREEKLIPKVIASHEV